MEKLINIHPHSNQHPCVGEKMKTCYECGKELKFWEGYFHPGLGHKELVCSDCFNRLEQSMETYRDFILSHS